MIGAGPVMIVGGKGFVGASLARHLVDRGRKVVCVEPKVTPGRLGPLSDQLVMVQGDVRDREGLADAMANHDIEAVVNVPFYHGRSITDELDVMAAGSWNVFDAAHNAGVRRVVFASSIAVHGPQSLHGPIPLNEDSPCLSSIRYGVYKRLAEVTAHSFNRRYDMEIAAIRLPAVYGPGAREGGDGVGLAAFAAATEGRVTLPYPPDQKQCLAFVDDVANALMAFLVGPAPEHTVYELGGQTTSYLEMAEIVRDLIPNTPVEFAPPEKGPAEPFLPYMIDNRRIATEFKVRHRTVMEGYREIIAALPQDAPSRVQEQ